jgi:hypothetical protein
MILTVYQNRDRPTEAHLLEQKLCFGPVKRAASDAGFDCGFLEARSCKAQGQSMAFDVPKKNCCDGRTLIDNLAASQ